jgi:hypothetical protein
MANFWETSVGDMGWLQEKPVGEQLSEQRNINAQRELSYSRDITQNRSITLEDKYKSSAIKQQGDYQKKMLEYYNSMLKLREAEVNQSKGLFDKFGKDMGDTIPEEFKGIFGLGAEEGNNWEVE